MKNKLVKVSNWSLWGKQSSTNVPFFAQLSVGYQFQKYKWQQTSLRSRPQSATVDERPSSLQHGSILGKQIRVLSSRDSLTS